MSFLDELAAAAESPASVWHQFALSHNPSLDDWYVFIEGKLDMPFYISALRSLIGPSERIWDFSCGGKQAVYQARHQVRQSHPDCERCIFFVDKDLDDVTGEVPTEFPDVFCTQWYSIENYFVNEEALEAVWKQLWKLPTQDARWLRVKQRFATALSLFHRLMLPVMSWLVLARRARMRPNVNNLNPARLFRIEDLVPRYSDDAYQALRRETGCDFHPALALWIGEARRATQLQAKRLVRGKFELWFFCRFVDSIFCTLRDGGDLRPDGSIQRTPEGIATALIGKLRLPPDVHAFLKGAVARSRHGHCRGGVQL